jgi:hypothetical protein
MRLATLALGLTLALSTQALAVSVWQLSDLCGKDAKAYCDGVGYGDAMTECLNTHKAKISPQCRALVDRINGGEKVSLF